MSWREFIAAALRELEAVLRDDRAARVAALSGIAVLFAMTLLTVLATRLRARRRETRATIPAPETPPERHDLGDWGIGGSLRRSAAHEFTEQARWPIDRVLPRRISGTIALSAVMAIGLWLAGLALTPRVSGFLASREWHFQPLYFAAHVIAVRLFVHVYAHGFSRGVAHLAVPAQQARSLVGGILGFPGALTALVICLPFVALDFLYLFSDRYQRAGGDVVLPIDYLMWGIWSVEWFLNAFIWVVQIGFLIKTWGVVKNHPFRAPIEIVLHDRHYKPFLQMSAQGASIVLAFTVVTAVYIWYTGGEITDYVGLGITAVLIVVGFLPPWLLLKSKVQRAVEEETLVMRRRLLRNLELAEAEAIAGAGHDQTRPQADGRSLEHRLDAAVAILRISYLEGRNQRLGSSEARAILIRMIAPAATMGWQFAKSQTALINEWQTYLAKLL
jgi:hypothetical protein